MPASRGIFVAIEGIDGAGKTTQVRKLAESLRAAGETVTASKEPTDGQWGRRLRESAAQGRLPLAEELDLFIKDRKEHLEQVILPALHEGQIVILDRYFYSTIAYQGSRGMDFREVERMMDFAPRPDVTFLLDADPTITLHRISHGRGESPNEFEQESSLKACRAIFRTLAAERNEIAVIDATLPTEMVSQRITDHMLSHALLHARCAKREGCEVFHCAYRQVGACQWAELKGKLSVLIARP